MCDAGQKPEIDKSKLLKIIAENSPLSVAEQADRLLLFLGDTLLELGRPDKRIPLSDQRRITRGLLEPHLNLGGALMYPRKRIGGAWLNCVPNISQYSDHIGVTFKGWEYYETLKRKPLGSRTAFMAML